MNEVIGMKGTAEMSQTIDLTPTWSVIGEMYIRFAESNEQAAIRNMAPEIRKAFAIATATVAAYESWDEPKKAIFDKVLKEEMAKHEPAQRKPETLGEMEAKDDMVFANPAVTSPSGKPSKKIWDFAHKRKAGEISGADVRAQLNDKEWMEYRDVLKKL